MQKKVTLQVMQSTRNPTMKWKTVKKTFYEAADDHVIPTKIVYLVVFVDDNKNKPINVVVPSDVSDCL